MMRGTLTAHAPLPPCWDRNEMGPWPNGALRSGPENEVTVTRDSGSSGRWRNPHPGEEKEMPELDIRTAQDEYRGY
jgi:hypothetical protein